MSKLISVLGIILLAIGLALGLLVFVNSGQMQVYGASLDTAVSLFVGGILSLGLGGVIAALDRSGSDAFLAPVEITTPSIVEPEILAPTPDADTAPTAEPDAEAAPNRIRFPGFGRKLAANAATATVATETITAAAAPSSVQETIDALDQAKADITNAMGGMTEITAPEPEAAELEEEAEAAEGELYVIEEKIIRGRPARILSDNTVEAETDEGWMRFENLEHLGEYLDAAGE